MGEGAGPPAAIGGEKDSSFGNLHAQAEYVIRFYADETVPIERRPRDGRGARSLDGNG